MLIFLKICKKANIFLSVHRYRYSVTWQPIKCQLQSNVMTDCTSWSRNSSNCYAQVASNAYQKTHWNWSTLLNLQSKSHFEFSYGQRGSLELPLRISKVLYTVLMLIRLSIFRCHNEGEGEFSLINTYICKLPEMLKVNGTHSLVCGFILCGCKT